MVTWNPSIHENYPFRPINIKTAPTIGLKWPPWAALDCQIWQFEVHTLNGRSGFFHSNQGLKSFPSWRQDCPLPPPINRSSFHVRSKKKIECKFDKKSAFLPCFSSFSAFSFSAPSATTPATVSPTTTFITTKHSTTSRGGCTTFPLLSLFFAKISFLSTIAAPAVAATTLSSGFHPYQQQ